ncbi:MAG: class I SAM-dependent methyltransferase [Candidatus Dadabacteria bacterium]
MDLIELKQIGTDFKRHPWELVRSKILMYFVDKLFNEKVSLVDIGSGDAFIAKSLARKFPENTIIAIDNNYSNYIVHNITESGLRNISFLEDISSAGRKFNGAILMDVLEHIEKPEVVLVDLKNHLESNSFVFVTVPAWQFLFSRHDEELGHFKRYTCKDLKQMVEKSGYAVRNTGYFFQSLFIVRSVQRLFNRGYKQSTLYNWKGGRFITDLLKNLFWVEFKFSWYLSQVGIRIPGLTCYCICQPLP